MKRNETYRVADVSKPPRKRKGAFNQVFDEDGKRVRGLCIRNGVYYAQVRFSPTQTNRLHLQDAKTIPQAIAARQELRRKIDRGEIRPPGAEEQEPAEEIRQASPQLRLSTVHFMNSPCTRQFLEDFAATRTADPDMARRTTNIVSRFLSILGDQDRGTLTVVSASHVLRCRDMRAAEIEASTVNSELSALNMAFEKAVNQGFLLVNPVDLENIQLPESSSVRSLEIWEVKALLLATSRVDWRTCIYTGFYTGPQLVDAAYRLWSDIVKDEVGHSYLSFPGTERKAARRIRIHPAFLEHLNSLPRVNEFICPSLAAL